MMGKIYKAKTRRERGAELLEMALTLPILLVLVAGTIDFANAWTLRQILVNAAREGARLGSTQPMLDLNTTNPGTVQEICQDVADYLSQAHMSTTFMNGTSTNPAAGCSSPTAVANTSSDVSDPVPLGWTYYSSGAYGLEIQRTVDVPSADGSGNVSSTRVTLTYPFQWPFGFNHIIDLIGQGNGSSIPSTIPIQANSTMANTE